MLLPRGLRVAPRASGIWTFAPFFPTPRDNKSASGGARPHTRTPELKSVPDNRPLASIEAVESGLATQGYVASRQIATAVYLSEQISKPILVEGPAGVGKTELAKAIAGWPGPKV